MTSSTQYNKLCIGLSNCTKQNLSSPLLGQCPKENYFLQIKPEQNTALIFQCVCVRPCTGVKSPLYDVLYILHTVCNFTHTHTVWFETECVILHKVCNFTYYVILHAVFNFIHCVYLYTVCVILHSVCNFTHSV